MSLDKFKSIKTKIEIQTDAEYSKSLTELPEKRIKKPILATLSTVAAVMLIAVAVGMWALIGRGVRNNGNLKVPASEAQTYAITDEIKTQLKDLYMHHMLFYMDDFDKDDPLTADEIVTYLTDINHDIIYESLTREEFAQFAKDTFNYDITIPEDIDNVIPSINDVDYITLDPIDLRVADGVVTVTYQLFTTHEKISFTLTEDNKLDYFVAKSTKNISDYVMTDFVRSSLESLYRNYSIVLLDSFDEKHPLTVEQVLKYCDESDAPIYDFDLTREEFSQFAKDTFNYDMEIPEDLVFELDQAHNVNQIVPEPVSFTVKDGVATATYQNPTVSVTVRYRYKDSDPFTFDYFLSVNTEIPEAKPDSSKKTMEDIAKQYHFECIHPFEEGELPYYVRYHISTLIDKSKIQQYQNKDGGMFLGIPYDDYKEVVTRFYGKDDMEGKEILEFSQMKSYEKYADLIRKDGELYVNLEIGGGMLDCEYEILDTQYKDGKVTVTFKAIEIGVDYGNSQPDTTILTYTSDDGLTPKQFISCLIATSEPLAPKDDIE